MENKIDLILSNNENCNVNMETDFEKAVEELQ